MMFIGDDAQGDSTPVVTEVSKRRIGFSEYLVDNGYGNIVNIEYPLGNYIYIPEEIHKVINQHPEVDGIFAISDAVACDVIRELENSGRRVPEEVKVIGFDGGRSFLNLGKKITSVGQSPELIAKAIGENIDNYYKKKKIINKIIPVYFEEGETA